MNGRKLKSISNSLQKQKEGLQNCSVNSDLKVYNKICPQQPVAKRQSK